MGIGTVHLVYPHGDRSSTPDAIGRELAARLGERYEVHLHDWCGRERIEPSPDAVLIGHSHPLPGTTMRRSLGPGWGRTILLQPFTPWPSEAGHLADLLGRVDLFLAMTGQPWMAELPTTAFAPFAPRIRPLDVAVDPASFPTVVDEVRPAGQRSVLYVGHDLDTKNLPYLAEIAARLPGVRVAWAGRGRHDHPPVERLGPIDFSTEAGRAVVREFDLLLTVSRAEANATTVVEAMAWGLVPLCTRETGYGADDGVVEVPQGDPGAAAAIVRAWIDAPEPQLEERRCQNRARLEDRFTWSRVAAQVVEAIEDPLDGTPGVDLGRRWALRTQAAWWRNLHHRSHWIGMRSALRAGASSPVRRGAGSVPVG
jgi:glycosyltransferase involved in cell wall biosynthesis